MAPIQDAKAPRNKRPSTLRIALIFVAVAVVAVQVVVLPVLYHRQRPSVVGGGVPVRTPEGSRTPGRKGPELRVVDREGVDAEEPPAAAEAGTESRPNEEAKATTTSSKEEEAPPDGTFNGLNVYYRDPSSVSSAAAPLHSTVHCVGEAFAERHPWTHRSCDFRNVCFDVDAREFVLFRSDSERDLQRALNATSLTSRGFVSVSSTMDTTVSIGGLNPVWGWNHKEGVLDMKSLEWFPRVVDGELSGGYYELSDQAVFVPFHSMAAHNVGHLVWDDFLPIYTLLSMFDVLDEGTTLALMRVVIRDKATGKGLWASCEWRDLLSTKCRSLLNKFLPLLGVEKPNVLGSTEKFDFDVSERQHGPARRSKYVCAKRGVAGMGMLTDHGLKKHGWDKPDYEYSHNVGRGPILYEFRNYMMRNVGLEAESTTTLSEPPYKIVFSRYSSKTRPRSRSFDNEINAVKRAFRNDTDVRVEAYQFSSLSVKEQVKITSEASVYITACGGGAVTSMFLPRGAGLVLYHDEYGRDKERKSTETPARLDWDYLNNASYLRAHWLPLGSIGKKEDVDLLVGIIRNELEVISHG